MYASRQPPTRTPCSWWRLLPNLPQFHYVTYHKARISTFLSTNPSRILRSYNTIKLALDCIRPTVSHHKRNIPRFHRRPVNFLKRPLNIQNTIRSRCRDYIRLYTRILTCNEFALDIIACAEGVESRTETSGCRVGRADVEVVDAGSG